MKLISETDKRDIALAIAAEIEWGELMRCADRHESRKQAYKRDFSIKVRAELWEVDASSLRRVLHGRKLIREMNK